MIKRGLRLKLAYGLLLCVLSMLVLIKISIPHSQMDVLREENTLDGWKYNTTFPVDVVYTWVNGSDPSHRDALTRLKAELARMKLLKAAKARNLEPQRFADNGGLLYSLRSLEKYANWIRHVFIVTNGQIPYWLDLDNPRVTIVTHEEIFDDVDYLPTFSSSAIEHNIHKIPGLSERFIYMNDDIFFGLQTSLDDFYTEENGTKIYQAFETPLKCSRACHIKMIKNDVCDDVCNFDHCIWDGGDCDVKTERSRPKDKDEPHSDHDLSIFYTNSIYNKAFGYKQRLFNLHAPLFIEKSINKKMAKRFSTEISRTCRQAVRSALDLQFGFSYMNFLMEGQNRSKYCSYIRSYTTAFMSITNNERQLREDLPLLQALER